MISLCLTLRIIRYVSRVNWSNPGKAVALSTTPQCSSYWKESLLVALDYGCQQLTHSHTHTDIYISWPTVVEGDPKALFEIAITLWCRGGYFSIYSWFVPYYAYLSLSIYIYIWIYYTIYVESNHKVYACVYVFACVLVIKNT